MPIIGPQCTRDGRTVCQRMSLTGLPVNSDGPGLSLIYGWPNEDRKAQGLPASFQGIELVTHSGTAIRLDHCPFCVGRITGSSNPVRSRSAQRPAADAPRPVAPPPVSERPAVALAPPPQPSRVATAAPQQLSPVTGLKLIREKLGLSQAELGEKLGLARSSVANYENGRSPLSRRLRSWIAKHEIKGDEAPRSRPTVAA